MDSFILRYHWRTFKDSNIPLIIKRDVKGSNTGIGIQFTDQTHQNWAVFINEFFEANRDAERRLVAEAVNNMAYKVSQ